MATQDLLKVKKPTQDLAQNYTSSTSFKTTAGNANSNHIASQTNTPPTAIGGVSTGQFNAQSNNNIPSANTAAATSPYGSAANASSYLQGLTKPGEFKSQYATQLSNLYDQIVNREPFSYDLNGDMLYQNYKDQYMQGGRQAMMDTMGQAAALTGGYGSSYASTAGNQAYQQYLTQLNNMVPQLYDRAYGRYQDEGNNLYNQMNMTQGLDDRDYSRWGDDYNRYLSERDYAMNLENMYYNREQDDKKQAQNMIAQIAANGKSPSAELLARAGWTRAEFKKMFKQAAPAASGNSGSKGGTTPAWKAAGFNSEAEYLAYLEELKKQQTPQTAMPSGSGSTRPGGVPGKSQIDQIIF